ncbi:hypothetical protein NGI46_27235 [Peribacillus butanolivorans]|uniref:hypothetical protein n=1 Tax=Peribacillus butanolivorans TaxID=421767 RepID=UPI00207C7F97|nr:hypothetical protein [Peribacillus butanolivorans]MCO0601008.1 hypothetical protein [Peribacillus butanolivorans]
MKLKSKLFSILFVLSLSFIVAIPALAASSSYDFNIVVSVDGKNKGNYHTLDKGSVSAAGLAYYTGSKKSYAPSKPPGQNVSYALYKDDAGADTYYGTVSQSVSSSSTPNKVNKFDKKFDKALGAKSSKYYLVIYTSDTGWKISGEGKVKN